MSLLTEAAAIAQLGCDMIGQYADVRARTLKLNALQHVVFRDIAIQNWLGGMSHESALVAAAQEVCGG